MIASRELEFRFKTGKSEPVRVTIDAPMPADEPHMWYCGYSIDGLTIRKSTRIAGIDAMQALTLAIGSLPAELGYLARKHDGEFWFLDEPGHMFSEVIAQV